MNLPRGIVPVVQTPFEPEGAIDFESFDRLIEDAIAAGATGFLVPAVASEVAALNAEERGQLARRAASLTRGRAALIAGASAATEAECVHYGELAESVGAAAWLVAVPSELYARRPEEIVSYFVRLTDSCREPLIIQDLEFSGSGLSLETIKQLRAGVPTLAGIKIETVPAGPKYSQVRAALGPEFYIAGGWAVPQMIEALDRGVDAMIPESSMVRVYARIDALHRSGRRQEALRLFRRLLPVLAFANQELFLSIAFFKRLLVRKGIFRSETMRCGPNPWDAPGQRIADELIEYYLELEASLEAPADDGREG